MNARRILFAPLALLALGAGTVLGQDWTGAPAYSGTVTRTTVTTVTTYAPAFQPAAACSEPASPATANPRSTFLQTNYAPSAVVPATYAAPTYAAPVYVRTNYVPVADPATTYAVPPYAAQPVVATACAPTVYRPVVRTFTPAYVAYGAAPVGPKVWVHPKVYVQGQPVRNLLTALTP